MNRKRNTAIFLSLFLLMTAGGAAVSGRPVDGIAAVVGSDIILLSEVYDRAAYALKEMDQAAKQGKTIGDVDTRKQELIKKTLEEIVDDTLITQQAMEMQIGVTTEEVNSAIENMARENNLDEETFARALEAQGTTMDEYKRQMRKDILKYKVLNLRVRGRIKIGEDEARQFYNNQVRDVRATGYFNGAHILLRVDRHARAMEVSEIREAAQALKIRIEAGEDFGALAREFSQDEVTAPHGGRLGRRVPGEIPRILDTAFLDMEPGEVAGPVRTAAGFHILLLESREDLGVQPFKEVQARIVNQLMQEEMIRQQAIWLKELRQRTFIDMRM